MSLIKDRELAVKQLRRCAAPIKQKTTKGIEKAGLMGQQRAVDSFEFGMSVRNNGYNIFIVGEPGSGRTTYATEELRKAAENMPAPDDWVYLNNFDDVSRPIAASLPAGRAKELAKETAAAVEELKTALSQAFEKSEFEDNKAHLVKAFQEGVNANMEELRKWADTKGFSVKRTPQGFVNLPMIEALPLEQPQPEQAQPEQPQPEQAQAEQTQPEQTQPEQTTSEQPQAEQTQPEQAQPAVKKVRREMQPDEFDKLPAEEQKRIQAVSEEVSLKTLAVLRVIREAEKELKAKIKELESQICRAATEPIMSELKGKFISDDAAQQKLAKWFDAMSSDVMTNYTAFLSAARDDNSEADFDRYAVNVFISNAPEGGAPVICENNPTYYNLVGHADYESKQGNLYTDFRKIIAGAIHKANGGYLFIDADEMLRQFMSWDALKRVLRYNELAMENIGEQLGYIPVSTLNPEPIPVHIKVVMTGTHYIYYLLNLYDPDFSKIFKVKAQFDSDMARTEASELQTAQFIAGVVDRESLLHFTSSALCEIIEQSSRMAEDRNKLSTELEKIADIAVEASVIAASAGKKLVGVDDVRTAIDKKIYRSNLIEEKILDECRNGVIKITTDGSAVGQINGLTVSQMIDYSFGSPVRITANVFMSSTPGVVNIEREVKMTGPIHNKGLLTLTSYLGRKYSRDFPLTVSAVIAFEQTYGGVEGDSASSTELYALLSAISEIPLNQGIGVTGSVDQFGYIQPIGGVNEKIEGFYRYCKVQGLTGSQGVMIPVQNEQHLMLSHEVVDAVKKHKFHIWSVSTIDEGIEILSGRKADDVHKCVQTELESWMERALRYKKLMSERVVKRRKKPEDE